MTKRRQASPSVAKVSPNCRQSVAARRRASPMARSVAKRRQASPSVAKRRRSVAKVSRSIAGEVSPNVPQVSEQPPPSFPLLRVLGPAKVRGGGCSVLGISRFWAQKARGGVCSSADPGVRDHGIGPIFSARFARRIALFSYVFAAFGSQIPFFRRASRAGLLHFPMFLQLFGLKNRKIFPARFARRIASFSYSFVTF